jgi:Na+-transporting NADH:ubiquinone oxidoreductase subunit B
MVAAAAIFAVIIGKEAFGGTGMNIVNPALLARAFLFFAYPSDMSGDFVWVSALSGGQGIIDGFSGATALAQLASNSGEIISGVSGNPVGTYEMFMGFLPGSIGETSVLAILIGAAILLYTGVASARIMASVFIGGFLMGGLLYLIGSDTNALFNIPPHQQLLLGGFAFGAVFMATDPVTGSQTPVGKIIYGLLIGIFAVLIRCLNPAYPEGVMLAILLMNVFAPLIDHYVVQANVKMRLKRASVAPAN